MITKYQLGFIDAATSMANEIAVRLKCSPKEAFPLAMKIREMEDNYELVCQLSSALKEIAGSICESSEALNRIENGVHMIGAHIEDCEVILQKM